ncbi:beta-lactamase regulator AmpE [Paraglaciecola sp. 20A4]|uniref:beta-lactamase regulator AmpE n=1 Tax=Paraglaciecola sp. 20A4 TaxID=2687288 RepID=UPI001408E6CD|nr:beta-lactamase regulator AmpE [Paraglaciecola sp. 20A4]
MTLISLLLVLFVERVTTKSRYWQADFYSAKYLDRWQNRDWLSGETSLLLLVIIIALPSLLIFCALTFAVGQIIAFIISTAILMVCVGCPSVRATYKCYLQAANRGDMEACNLYADQIIENNQNPGTFGQNLVWQNYRHYAAVALFFVILGAPGAVLYVLARAAESRIGHENNTVNKIMYFLDWLPVRITALGFLLVGHFSHALPIWLGHFLTPKIPAKKLLIDVSRAAEDVEPDEHNCTEEPCTLVRLAKRNILFLMAVISGLTLVGWLN